MHPISHIMAPELRKRKAPPPAPEPAPKKTSKVSKAVSKAKEVVTGKPAEPEKAPAAAAAKAGAPAVGDVITLDGFGGEIETNDGKKTTLKALVDESKSGVVLFTYPKASTPGCKHKPSHCHVSAPRASSLLVVIGGLT